MHHSTKPLPLPFDGTESIDYFRAENLTLKIENNKLEQDNVELRHSLQLALTKASSWGGMKQRVTLNKPQSIVAERTWVSDPLQIAQAASLSGAAVLDSMEQQMAELKEQVHVLVADKQKLLDTIEQLHRTNGDQRAEIERLAALKASGDKGTAVAYLQNQISFLHSEVERLEGIVRLTQTDAVAKVRAIEDETAKHLKEKDAEVASMRDELARVRVAAGLPKRGGGKVDGEDLMSRCRMMEVQLAASLAEKNALHIENGDLHAKIRKLEAAAREKKQLLNEIQRSAASETHTSSEHAQRLSLLLAASNEEKQSLTAELDAALARLNVPRASSETQTVPPALVASASQCDPPAATATQGCQVDSIQHFADAASQSMQTLRHALQTKCTEADDGKMQLATLAAVHKETLVFLESTKNRLSDEMARRSQLEVDVEGLSLELRSMQQQISQQGAIDREKDIIVHQAQESQREAQAKLIRVEEEYRELEREVGRHRKDLQLLVANQNVQNQQVNEVNRQNAVLHEEIQKLRIALEHDKYVIQARDAELRDVVSSYQMLAKETDVLGTSREVLEKENEGLRQTIRSLEERCVMCNEQIGHLHAREQQLSLDLQSFDHEIGQLHRRLQQSQTREAENEARAQQDANTIRALELAADEMRRSLAELSKQIVIRDNENMLMRNRCGGLEREINALSTSQRTDSRRLRDLEEANAQLVVRQILSQQPSQTGFDGASSATASNVSTSEPQRSQVPHHDAARARVMELEQQLREANEAKDRFERLAFDQAATLSRLSQ